MPGAIKARLLHFELEMHTVNGRASCSRTYELSSADYSKFKGE